MFNYIVPRLTFYLTLQILLDRFQTYPSIRRLQMFNSLGDVAKKWLMSENATRACRLLPRDAMLAQVLAVVECLCVCLSLAGIASKWLHRSSICLRTGSPRTMLRCILKKLGYLKNNGTSPSLWNFVPNSGLRKFRHGTPTVGECDMNSDSGWSRVDSIWRRRQTCMARAVYSRRRLPTVNRTGRPALYTARWSIGRRRAVPSTWADTLVKTIVLSTGLSGGIVF